MNQPSKPSGAVLKPDLQWPVGVRLRFKLDAALRPEHRHLRGTPVLILSELRLLARGSQQPSWRQEILAMSNGCRTGWAQPEHLELAPDSDIPEPDYAGARLRQHRF